MEQQTRKSLGGNSVRKGVNPIVTANVVIPQDQDRNEYIKHCYSTRTVMIRDVLGGVWTKCFVPKGDIENIVFPPDSETLGSLVIANRVQKHNYPVIVAIIDLKNVATIINDEYQFRKQSISKEGNVVDIQGRAKEATLDFSVNSSEDDKGEMNISVSNPNSTSKLNVFVKGFINIVAEKDLEITSHKDFILNLKDSENNTKAFLKYIQEDGLYFEDEFGNVFHYKEKEILIKETSGNKIFIKDDLIEISKGGKIEYAVRGETLLNLIKEILTAIKTITVPTSTGISGNPLNAAVFTTIENKLKTFLSKRIKLE